MSLLVVDVGTSAVRAGLVEPDGKARELHRVTVLPTTPGPGTRRPARTDSSSTTKKCDPAVEICNDPFK